MLSHRNVIAFTKKGARKVDFSRPLIVFHVSFSPRLRFLLDMIFIKQWQKCPIEAFVLEHEVFPQRAQMDTDFYLRTRTKGRWPKGKAIAISELLFNRNGQKLFRNFSLIIFSKIIIPDNSLQDLHEVPEHLRSARKRHRSALCDALPDKEVPSAWSISDNSCKKNPCNPCNPH